MDQSPRTTGDPSACATVRMVLSARRDGEVSEIESAAADRHLETCGACTEFDRSIERLSRRLRVAPRLEPRRPLWTARPPRRVARPLAALGVAAALVLAGVVGSEVASMQHGTPAARHGSVRVASLDAHSLQFSLHEQRVRELRGAPDLSQQIELLRTHLG
jgi:predicted anti-sigma-YlaC factor YlaD